VKKFLSTVFIITLVSLVSFRLASVRAQGLTYLLSEGFESGSLSGWTTSGSIGISSSPVHSGTKAAGSTGGDISRWMTLDTGKSYKLTAWVYLTGSSAFPDWGGPTVDVLDQNWNPITSTPYLQGLVPTNTWAQVALSFKPTTSQTLIRLGGKGGAGNTVAVSFDDILLFVKPAVNTPPTVSISANPSTGSVLPATVNFSSTPNDPDGAVEYFFWDFGDGGRSNLSSPSHIYIGNGSFTAKLTIVDDNGAATSNTTQINISDPNSPSLVITNPTQSGSNYTISGTSSGANRLDWSTDRGLWGTASGTTSWSFTVNLDGFGGKNRILITASDAGGKITSRDIVIDYRPAGKVSVSGGAGGITHNSNSVEKWDKFEATFNIVNSVASTPDLPFATNLPAGMLQGTGITIDGVFTSPTGKIYRQPAFRYQPYTRNPETPPPNHSYPPAISSGNSASLRPSLGTGPTGWSSLMDRDQPPSPELT